MKFSNLLVARMPPDVPRTGHLSAKNEQPVPGGGDGWRGRSWAVEVADRSSVEDASWDHRADRGAKSSWTTAASHFPTGAHRLRGGPLKHAKKITQAILIEETALNSSKCLYRLMAKL